MLFPIKRPRFPNLYWKRRSAITRRRSQLRPNVIPPPDIDQMSGLEGRTPILIKGRYSTATHQVVTDEVGAETFDDPESDIRSLNDLSAWAKREKEASEDEPWARLNELGTFALCRFGLRTAFLGIGVYNKERMASTLRQGLTERGRMWGIGVRVPIGDRIAHGSETTHRGAASGDNIPEETIVAPDFIPISQDFRDRFQPDGEKFDPRQKNALSIERWVRADKQHTLMFGFLHGKEQAEERAGCIMQFARIHEARIDLFTVDFLESVFGEMDFLYCSRIREGDRETIRLGADGSQKPSIVRLALNPYGARGSRWGTPTVFLTRRCRAFGCHGPYRAWQKRHQRIRG